MRYWLLRRPPHYGDINPAFANQPYEYDKVSVNPRLHPGDIVYLIAAYNELYGWGHVEKKESYQDNELNGRAYKIIVTRPVVQILTSHEEVKTISELASLFQTDVILIELNATQVNALNRLLTSKGALAPPPKLADESDRMVKACSDFPRVQVPKDVKIWMSAAYERVRSGKTVDPQQMVIELWSQIPDFNYKAIDQRLMYFGFELTLLGILQIDPTTELCDQTDQVIRFIKERIQKQPKIERMTAEEVSEALEIPEPRIALIFVLMNHLGDFWNGAGSSGDVPGYTTITIKDEHVKREYLKYQGLTPLLERFAKTNEKLTVQEPHQPEFIHEVLDWKLKERLDEARNWVDRLPPDEVLNHDNDHALKAVERFAIAIPKLAEKPLRDEAMPELEDLISDRKTGSTGHIFLVPVNGDAEWFQEVNMQTVESDEHPLGFLNKARSWIYLKLTVSLDDADGNLKRKLDERMALLKDYGAYVSNRIISFNTELAEKLVRDLNKRKMAIQKGRAEAEAIGLATAHNPKHAETAIQIERLIEGLSARFTGQANDALSSSTELQKAKIGDEMSDLHQDALRIARYMYDNKFIGSRSITLSELRGKINLSEEDFDTADEYLLEAKIYEGTMGGDAGQRWLTPSGVDFVRKQEDKREQVSGVVDRGSKSSIDVFISHSSKDADIAKALVLLLRSALNIPAERIRCTSVDGYRLRVGASTDDELRTEVRESRVFLGLITQTSIESTYVLFELGARWGGKLQLAPVLVSSDDKGLLRGPLGALNAVACDSTAQVFQLVENVASELGLPASSASTYQEYVDALVGLSRNATVERSADLPPRAKEFDFERMAKHVMNYFAANRFKKVGFESLRKYVNAKYSDDLLFEMIDRFPDSFRRVTLAGDRPAVGLVPVAVAM